MRMRTYTADDVDAIVAYCADLDACFVLMPNEFEGRRQLHLRLSPSRNNQQRGVNWADDFTLESATLRMTQGP
jgi:hypothetical protein